MPQKLEKCVKEVKKKIKRAQIKKTYKCGKKLCRTNPYSLCNAATRTKR